MTELTNIVAAERRLPILHPASEEPVGLVLFLLPDTHEQVKAAGRKAINERMSHRGKVTAEQLESNRLKMLCASVGGWEWEGGASFHNEKPDFSEQSLRQVFKELPWVAEQADLALANRAEFFRGPDSEGG